MLQLCKSSTQWGTIRTQGRKGGRKGGIIALEFKFQLGFYSWRE